MVWVQFLGAGCLLRNLVRTPEEKAETKGPERALGRQADGEYTDGAGGADAQEDARGRGTTREAADGTRDRRD